MDATESIGASWPRAGVTLVAVAILLLAFGLRAWRIDGPYEHTDELIARHVSHHLETHPGWDNNWKICEIPIFSAFDQYNFSAYLYATHLFRRAAAPLLPAQWNEARLGVQLHRLFSVLCGTAAVGLLMLVAGQIGGRLVMLLAGTLAAVNVQLVLDAHYARPEAFMTLLQMAVICLGFLPVARIWRPALMALLVGLLAATKLTNALLLALAAYAAWQVWRQRKPEQPAWWPAGVLLGAVGFCFAVGFALGAPFALLHPAAYVTGIKFLSAQYSGVHAPYSLPDHGAVWPIMRDCFISTHGLPLLAAIGLGAAASIWRRQWPVVVLLFLPVLVLVVFFGAHRVFVERNLSPVLPSALLLAVIGFAAPAAWLWREGGVRLGLTIAAAVVLASLPGDRALALLLREGVTEIEPARYQAYLTKLTQDFPNRRLATTSLYSDRDMNWLRGELVAGQGEVILTVVDFSDAYKARWLPVMEREFRIFPLAEYRGTFADYPLGGLNNFHGARLRTYLVRPR